MFDNPEVLFYRKVILWRLVSSVTWALLLTPLLAAAFVLLSRFRLRHLVRPVSECLPVFTSVREVLGLLMICEMTVAFGLLNFRSYTVMPAVAHSKAVLLCRQLRPHRVLSCLYHCVMGTVLSWGCDILSNQRALVIPCPQNSGFHSDLGARCLNENGLVSLLAGGFVGFSYSLLGVVHNRNYVYFDTTQESKLFSVCRRLPRVLKRSATHACYNVVVFMVFYSCIGYIPKECVCKALGLHLDSSSVHPLHLVARLLDPPLLYHLWLSTTFLLFTWDVTLMLFRIFVTQVYTFPLQYHNLKNIARVLAGKHPTLVKYLALQDLALLSQDYSPRCKEVLRIHRRGGKAKRAAHTWLAVSHECLSRLTALTKRLNNYNSVATRHGGAGAQVPASINTPTLVQSLQRHREQEAFLKKDGSAGQGPELALFADCQAHIWAVEALANFVKVCVDERRDNVARGSFHHIFCCMIDLKEAVDQHLSLSGASRPRSCSMEDSYKTFPFVLQGRLQDAIKMMSYSLRIYLRKLPMSAEHQKRLQTYMQ
ncbi:nucleoporin NDC1-like [Nelusetta ayraudi]|uniref:nucleoporin NDC1-like n=1 Tax=Nelusetta ayraudi TaxID=303726 RepID=UPI003F6EAF37